VAKLEKGSRRNQCRPVNLRGWFGQWREGRRGRLGFRVVDPQKKMEKRKGKGEEEGRADSGPPPRSILTRGSQDSEDEERKGL
jgi:hypothetical protein